MKVGQLRLPPRSAAVERIGDTDARGEAWLYDRVPADDLPLLARQGGVFWEQRGARRIAKLRYRHGSRQIVRYIGGDAELIESVAAALAVLQWRRRQAAQWRQWRRLAARAVRASWAAVAPELIAVGYRLHGRTARWPRGRDAAG